MSRRGAACPFGEESASCVAAPLALGSRVAPSRGNRPPPPVIANGALLDGAPTNSSPGRRRGCSTLIREGARKRRRRSVHPGALGAPVFVEDAGWTRRRRPVEPSRSPNAGSSRRRSGKARPNSATSPTTSRSSHGWPTKRAGSSGTTAGGSTTREQPWNRCRAGAGRRSITPTTSTGSLTGSVIASRPARRGRTRFRSDPRTAVTGGSCRKG